MSKDTCDKCKKGYPGDSWTNFFSCTYCEKMCCKNCHCPKECLKGIELDILGFSSFTDSRMLLYISRLLTVQNRATSKILDLLCEIERNTSC